MAGLPNPVSGETGDADRKSQRKNTGPPGDHDHPPTGRLAPFRFHMLSRETAWTARAMASCFCPAQGVRSTRSTDRLCPIVSDENDSGRTARSPPRRACAVAGSASLRSWIRPAGCRSPCGYKKPRAAASTGCDVSRTAALESTTLSPTQRSEGGEVRAFSVRQDF